MLLVLMRDSSALLLVSIIITAFSGVPGLFLKQSSPGQGMATLSAVVAALLALPSAIFMLTTRQTATYVVSWTLPFDACEIGLDPLSLFFLIPIFIVFLCGSIYANGYWPAVSNRSTESSVTFFYGLLAAAMALVVVARNGALLLIAWEIMALAGYFLLVTEHEKPDARAAGAVYLIASHIGVAALYVLFSLLRFHTGTFLFPAPGGLHIAAASASILFIAALIGFGSKAGLMPLHIWLPAAHANAPSHVSAIFSGVMIKIGVYGILRVLSFMPERPLWWGALLVIAGIASALLGICLAASQRNIKRLLAYSSIENIGIIATGLGIGLIGQTTGNAPLAFLGMTGALLHILNHSLFKPLLFFSAGSVVHATGTLEMDRMGGLAKRMPWSAFLSLCGAMAICGLPPFNGFVSEFLLYMGFFGEARAQAPYIALGAPLLALVGGVAVICFVKMYGITFLGAPRSEQAADSHEAPFTMIGPMIVLAGLCLVGGLFPQAFLVLVRPVPATLTPLVSGSAVPSLQPIWFTLAGLGVLGLGAAVTILIRSRINSLQTATASTWGCGYLKPTSRMRYTGTSFSQTLTSLMSGIVRTRVSITGISGYTPKPAALFYLPEETILERLIQPLFRIISIAFSFLRRLQQGQAHVYIFYIFATLFLLMLWVH
ncbi:MAG: proton-conducting transporter membrane subunit [Geobacteraceae bacterium]